MCQNIRVAKRTANCGSTVRDTSKHTTPQTHHNIPHHKHIMSNHITQPISLGTEHHQHETGHWTANCSIIVTNSSQHTTPHHNIPHHKHIISNHITLLISSDTGHHEHETGNWMANYSSMVTNSSRHTTPHHNIPHQKHIISNHITLLISLG